MATNKEWTQGRYKSFITSTLRGGFRRYPPKYESLKEAQVGKKINTKSQRLAMHYECCGCKGHFPAKEVQVDHILPVVALKKDSSRGIYLLHASFVHRIIYKYSAKVAMTQKPKQKG